ncbi:sensor histidine kinase [Lachnospiraceae bacterium 54-53]
MNRLSVMKKLLLCYSLLILGLMALMGICILPFQLRNMDQNLEDKITWTARLISEDPGIIRAVEEGQFTGELEKKLDALVLDSGEIDYIVITGTDRIRLYHPEHDRIGEPFAGGDEGDIINGGAPYTTTRQGSVDVQKRAFHAIRDGDGKVLGFTMVSASLATIHRAQKTVIVHFVLIFSGILVFGIFFAYVISRSIRRSLLGFEPGTFARMYLQREEILDNLNEGIAAVGKDGDFLYCNHSAKTFFPDERLPDDPPVAQEVEGCFHSGVPRRGLLFEINGNTLLINLIPLVKNGFAEGVLLITRDRTEVVQMAEQMTGMNHIVEALRSNTHEYLNKLHVISGLLQIGEVKQAVRFINGDASETETGYHAIIRQIQNRTVAALLLGKQSRAKELGIHFILRKDSFLNEHNHYLSTGELITITGNLLENAFDAVKKKQDMRQVELFIGSDEKGITIVADDTGCGMTKEQIEMILRKQYTTKTEGHGIGLRLVQEIVHKHQGYLEIESEPGEGTSFTIMIDKESTQKEEGNSHD